MVSGLDSGIISNGTVAVVSLTQAASVTTTSIPISSSFAALPQGYYVALSSTGGSLNIASASTCDPNGGSGTCPVSGAAGTGTSNVGVFRAGFEWVLDANGNMMFDGTGPGLNLVEAFGGTPGDVPVTGDWSGTGTTKIGIYRASNGLFLLDYNDNGTFDGCVIDRCYQYFPTPTTGDIPVVGDWTGTGTSKIGIYRPGTGQWFLDTNGDGIFELGVDFDTNYGGITSPIADVPVTGDWTGSGTTKIGIFRAGYLWLLNTTGSGTFAQGQDAVFPFGGIAGDVPVVGDWNNSGITKVGVFRMGFFWVLDTTGTHTFIQGVDQAFPFGGLPGDVPLVGKWRRP